MEVRESSRGGVGGVSGWCRATFASAVERMGISFARRLTARCDALRRQPFGERDSRWPHAVAHIVDLLFSQSARCAVRKKEGCEKSLCLAMFGGWDSGTAPFCNDFRCVSEVGRREEGEGRTEAKGDGKRKTLH